MSRITWACCFPQSLAISKLDKVCTVPPSEAAGILAGLDAPKLGLFFFGKVLRSRRLRSGPGGQPKSEASLEMPSEGVHYSGRHFAVPSRSTGAVLIMHRAFVFGKMT